MEKLWDLRTQRDYELIVLDTPPTAHALDFLDAPNRMLDFLDNEAAKWLLTPALAAGKFGLSLFNLGGSYVAKTLSSFTGTETLQELASFMLAIASHERGLPRARPRACASCWRTSTTGFVLVTSPDAGAAGRGDALPPAAQAEPDGGGGDGGEPGAPAAGAGAVGGRGKRLMPARRAKVEETLRGARRCWPQQDAAGHRASCAAACPGTPADPGAPLRAGRARPRRRCGAPAATSWVTSWPEALATSVTCRAFPARGLHAGQGGRSPVHALELAALGKPPGTRRVPGCRCPESHRVRGRPEGLGDARSKRTDMSGRSTVAVGGRAGPDGLRTTAAHHGRGDEPDATATSRSWSSTRSGDGGPGAGEAQRRGALRGAAPRPSPPTTSSRRRATSAGSRTSTPTASTAGRRSTTRGSRTRGSRSGKTRTSASPSWRMPEKGHGRRARRRLPRGGDALPPGALRRGGRSCWRRIADRAGPPREPAHRGAGAAGHLRARGRTTPTHAEATLRKALTDVRGAAGQGRGGRLLPRAGAVLHRGDLPAALRGREAGPRQGHRRAGARTSTTRPSCCCRRRATTCARSASATATGPPPPARRSAACTRTSTTTW